MINIAKEIQDKEFIVIKKLFSKKQVNSLFQSYNALLFVISFS